MRCESSLMQSNSALQEELGLPSWDTDESPPDVLDPRALHSHPTLSRSDQQQGNRIAALTFTKLQGAGVHMYTIGE